MPYWLVLCVQIPEEGGSPPGLDSSGGMTPDVGDAELADVARLWQECQHGRSARRRARTSVTSMYSSGAPPEGHASFCCVSVTRVKLWEGSAPRDLPMPLVRHC